MAEIKPDIETFARIKVVGVGGSGGNAISRMIEAKIKGVEFVEKLKNNFRFYSHMLSLGIGMKRFAVFAITQTGDSD